MKEERSSQGPQEVALGIRPLTPESTQRSGYLSTVSIDGSGMIFRRCAVSD